VSEIVSFRTQVAAESLASLWADSFTERLGVLGLRRPTQPDQPTTVVSADGNDSIWFDNDHEAWRWLSTHDGSMLMQTDDGRSLDLQLLRPANGEFSEVCISVDLPGGNTKDGRRESLLVLAEDLVGTTLMQTGASRVIAYSETILEWAMAMSDSVDEGIQFPTWLGYWNVFPLEYRPQELKRLALQTGLHLRTSVANQILTLARWPWLLTHERFVAVNRSFVELVYN
jgi:hypothetical protein